MNCYICHVTINCTCINEQGVRIKYRSCAMTDSYPKSQLHFKQEEGGGHRLVHICSKRCECIENANAQEYYNNLMKKK